MFPACRGQRPDTTGALDSTNAQAGFWPTQTSVPSQSLSGTPLSELSATVFGSPFDRFVQPRGSLGRSPSLYDLDARLAWEPLHGAGAPRPRLLLDAYHLGNPRRAVFLDPVHYHRVNASGQPVATNPNFLKPLLLQPPAAFRFGVELDW